MGSTLDLSDMPGVCGVKTITLRTVYGVDFDHNFETGETIRKYRADVTLSDGEAQVVLEMRS